MHVWPEFMSTPCQIALAASSGSASSRTNALSRPESSSVLEVIDGASVSAIAMPTLVEPVKTT